MGTIISLMLPLVFVFSVARADNSHRVRVINEGSTALNQILNIIEGAQKTLDLEYFLYRKDLGGKIVTHALLKKAKDGVKIRMLLDHSTTLVEITDLFAQRFIDNGIEVRYFSRSLPFSSKDTLWRNHRKLIIADRSRAMMGGRNIGNEYFDQNSKFNFIDRDIYVEGPIVTKMTLSFEQFWNSKETSIPRIEWFYRERYNGLSRLKSWILEVDKFFEEDPATIARLELQKIIGGPLLSLTPVFDCREPLFVSDNAQIPKHPFVNKLFLQLLKNAKREIVTETPYFILKHQGYELLMKFLDERGRFVMLTNGLYSTDVGLVAAAFMERIKEPIKKGAKVFVYGGSHPNYPMVTIPAERSVWGIHSKTVVFDQKHTLIGTFNLDPRSVNFNHELAFVCMNNPELAAFVISDIQAHKDYAGQLGLDGMPMDNRYPYFEASPIVNVGLWVFTPLIQYFDEFL